MKGIVLTDESGTKQYIPFYIKVDLYKNREL